MRQLKNSFLYLAILINVVFLYSCTNSQKKPQETTEQSQHTESTGQIVDKYVNTLTTVQNKAKKAAEAENKRVEEEGRLLNLIPDPHTQ